MNLDTAGSRPMSGPTHTGGPSRHDPQTRGPLGDRIEATTRKSVPDPKGKPLVMIILAIAVLAALAWEFSGKGAASQATRRAVERVEREKEAQNPPLAREDPAAPKSPQAEIPPTAPPRRAPSAAALIDVKIGETKATLPPALAVAAWVEADAAQREAMRLQILDALLPLAERKGSAAREAFEAAAWLVDGASEDATEAILRLTNATTRALEDDDAALGAILFLARVPDGVDKRTALSLDGVIVDSTRPLQVRIAAARIRPKDGQSRRITDLIADPMTHPALRDALK
jgi:hypothetical protein